MEEKEKLVAGPIGWPNTRTDWSMTISHKITLTLDRSSGYEETAILNDIRGVTIQLSEWLQHVTGMLSQANSCTQAAEQAVCVHGILLAEYAMKK
jgi:hypothetical protein